MATCPACGSYFKLLECDFGFCVMEVSSVTDVSGVLIRSMGVVVCCSCGLGVKTCLCFHFTYGKLS